MYLRLTHSLMRNLRMNSNTVNLFFACDDSYVPFLAVTLESIRCHKSEDRIYVITVLHTGIEQANIDRLTAEFEQSNFHISFADISESVEAISKRLHTRDYYSKSTYYRLFIPDLYKDIDKALYLDCDIVLCADVAELYDTDIENDLVGAVSDGFVRAVPRLHGYVTERIGVSTPADYFNAGVLLMNLKEMRKDGFENKFFDLLKRVTFEVAQDQDYLNALCYGRRKVIVDEWNVMPGFSSCENKEKLIHFNLDSKPWHKDGVEFSDIFWKYANASCFSEEINLIHKTYREKRKSARETKNLIEVADIQAKEEKTNIEIREILTSIRG